jgi:hypothetical protein
VNFTVTSSKNNKVSVTISNVNGVTLISRNVTSNSGSVQINMNGLPAGTYSLTVRDGVTAGFIKAYQIIKVQ